MGKEHDVVVGIDFGTTYSGVISYEKEISKWGYQVGPLWEVIRGSKLLLDESQDPEYAPSLSSKSLLIKYGKSAVHVSGEYIGHLVLHVKDTLRRRFGEVAKSMRLKFVLTVPAVWSDKAKDATLRAAMIAGIEPQQIFLVSEPEAAALHSLQTIQPNSIAKKNDVFVVCDAGGGTVDLISYKVQGLDPLSLEEVTEGTGAVCLSEYQGLPAKSKESALSFWRDMIKPNFGEESDCDVLDVDHYIPLPGAGDQPDKNIEGGFIHLEGEEIKEIFEPIILKVEELVRAQLESIAHLGLNSKAIVLVGGFGSSGYLFKRLKDCNYSIAILQPPNAWAAVVSGAVLHGLEGNRVEARFSRSWYGVSSRTKFDKNHHAQRRKHWYQLEEDWFVDDHMTWYIQKVVCEDI
ncbi:actin-like ATPase domain-containing protein [Penicillium frequentans]|uniref:Actin-like ATPase domain-containing protein n=1 Tax=Penicillium frequentans TaxID=3151616 RepID=A0AAD6GHF1_9EURO|nr:actin-like ATPase domain-containing protein [Penicillium glabrum]